MGNMLGVRREDVTRTALKLQKQGAITSSRGNIKVLDRNQLEALSCECYEVVKKETALLLLYLPQPQALTDVAAIPRVVLPTTKTRTNKQWLWHEHDLVILPF